MKVEIGCSMDICEATEAFTAMDADGHPQTVPKSAILHSIGNGAGFMGRIDVGVLASFVYLDGLYYVQKTGLESKTKPLVLATGWRRNGVVRVSRNATA